jgi:cyanophycinase
MGYILLAGGAEFGKRMAEPDRRAIELAGGPSVPVRIIPTAAAPDNNHERAGANGVRWFQSLGATDVRSLPLVDAASARDQAITASLRSARLIYLLGGFPAYLGQTLQNSPAWQATLEAYRAGAVIAGSSAGAMVLCQFYRDPDSGDLLDGLDLVHNKNWAPMLAARLPDATLLGIDEQVGIVDDGHAGDWAVFGGGTATVYQGKTTRTYHAGETFRLR